MINVKKKSIKFKRDLKKMNKEAEDANLSPIYAVPSIGPYVGDLAALAKAVENKTTNFTKEQLNAIYDRLFYQASSRNLNLNINRRRLENNV